MARHDLLGLYVSKLAFSKWLHDLQHEAHRCMLGCSRKGRGSAKNICIRKISKQKYIIKKRKRKVLRFTKQKRFHQVKVTSPFLLNKMMATSITKQPRRLDLQLITEQPRNACFTSITKQPKKTRFTTNYKTAKACQRQIQLIKGRRLVVMVDSQSRLGSL